jgi:hypothetical protein
MNALDSRSVNVALPTLSLYFDVSMAVVRVLFLRSLNFYGLDGVPPHTEWAREPAIFIKAFRASWWVIAALTGFAILTSALRGAERRGNRVVE